MQISLERALEIFATLNNGKSQSVERTNTSTIDGGMRKVIVRSASAGVQFGTLVSYSSDGTIVILKDARQIWSWTAAEGGTLADCAVHGISKGKVSASAPKSTIIGACAIIDCTDVAIKSLEAAKWA